MRSTKTKKTKKQKGMKNNCDKNLENTFFRIRKIRIQERVLQLKTLEMHNIQHMYIQYTFYGKSEKYLRVLYISYCTLKCFNTQKQAWKLLHICYRLRKKTNILHKEKYFFEILYIIICKVHL